MDANAVSPEQIAWERGVSRAITSDGIWKLDAYRSALYLMHVARADQHAMVAATAGEQVAGQLLRAAGSVSANLGEGYSRSTRADRLRFMSYSLGSIRECVSWYEATRGALSDERIEDRLILLSRLRALTLGLIRAIRDKRPSTDRFDP